MLEKSKEFIDVIAYSISLLIATFSMFVMISLQDIVNISIKDVKMIRLGCLLLFIIFTHITFKLEGNKEE